MVIDNIIVDFLMNNFLDLIYQKLISLEMRLMTVETKLFKLIAALEFIDSMKLNSMESKPIKPVDTTYNEPMSQLF